MLEFAESIARRSGELLLERLSHLRTINTKTNDRDLVTDADRASEHWLVEAIRDQYPDHNILGEEGTGDQTLLQQPGYTWVIDPLDGTVNYAHNLPIFCVSVGLLQDGQPLLGVVYIPRLDELFSAQVGQGATCNGKTIHVSDTALLSQAVLATGFPYDKHESPRNNLENFSVFTQKVRGIRRLGAAAVDLCFVAAGRLDGYWEEKLHPWDMAAGIVIVQEAGGVVSNYYGQPIRPEEDHVIAAGPDLHPTMQQLLEPYATKHHLARQDSTSSS
ncbi:MAG: inositol monophosphatase [Deltaproteobacteria bacterium]|nr:MAG: inositol monophosphatase [Deltaproteobacteria bacterium]